MIKASDGLCLFRNHPTNPITDSSESGLAGVVTFLHVHLFTCSCRVHFPMSSSPRARGRVVSGATRSSVCSGRKCFHASRQTETAEGQSSRSSWPRSSRRDVNRCVRWAQSIGPVPGPEPSFVLVQWCASRLVFCCCCCFLSSNIARNITPSRFKWQWHCWNGLLVVCSKSG